jgi:amino acid transporter
MALQKLPVSVLPFQAALWPYGAYLGFWGSLFFIFFQGWTAFAPWDTSSFFMNYVVMILFAVLTVGWKLWHKTKWVNLEEVDLLYGRRDILM